MATAAPATSSTLLDSRQSSSTLISAQDDQRNLQKRRTAGDRGPIDDLDILAHAQASKKYQPRTIVQQFDEFFSNIYDAEKGTFFERNLIEWARGFLYYFFFYFAIFLVTAASFFVFYFALSKNQPWFYNYDGIMFDRYNRMPSPGMGIRPLPFFDTTLIAFKPNKPETYKLFTDHIQAFLKSYQSIFARTDIRRKDCGPGNLPDGDVGCMFQPELKLKFCGRIDSQAALGYDIGKPCVLLKLNKIYDWRPDPIKCSKANPSASNDSRPVCDGLTDTEIDWFNTTGRPGTALWELFDGSSVPVTCEGINPPDQENILDIEWDPDGRGYFPTSFYPFLNQRGYLAPLVSAQFNISRGVLVMIRCKSWAKNIPRDPENRDGCVQFEMMLD